MITILVIIGMFIHVLLAIGTVGLTYLALCHPVGDLFPTWIKIGSAALLVVVSGLFGFWPMVL